MDECSRTHYKSPAWPKILLATLTLLGVFKGRPFESCRACMLCRRKRMGVRDAVGKSVCFAHNPDLDHRQSVRFRQFADPDPVFC